MDITAASGLLFTAGLLGVTHGLEPDHVGGIVALTHADGDATRAAIVGGCFGVGHGALVGIWVAGATVLFDVTSIPVAVERFGFLVVGVALSVFALSLGITGTRRLLHRHRHEHGGRSHVHVHLHPWRSRHTADEAAPHPHAHGVLRYLAIGTVGAFFTLSPPLSMIAFISVVLGRTDPTGVVWVVGTYAVAIVATMAAVGAGAGSMSRHLEARGERLHDVATVVVSVVVFAFAVKLLATTAPGVLW